MQVKVDCQFAASVPGTLFRVGGASPILSLKNKTKQNKKLLEEKLYW